MAKTKQSQVVNPDEIGSAISSWSGFVYQGKVALYHVMKMFAGGTAKNSYDLQLDSLEDFAILGPKDKPISLHQVKALLSQAYDTYKSPFKKLVNHGNDRGCTSLWFHTAREITDKSVKDIETAHAPMKIYMYGSKSHCPLADIDSLIEEEIQKYYQNHIPANVSVTYIAITRNVLEDLILARVITAHSNIHTLGISQNFSAYKERVSFSSISALLSSDLRAKASDEKYFLALTKKDLARYYQEYCMENDIKIDENCKVKLEKFMMFMSAMDSVEILTFIRGLMPHRKFKLECIQDYKDSNIQKDEMKKSFFHCLKELPEILPLIFNGIGWIGQDSAKYSPTSILLSNTHLDDICRDIIENIMETDVALPYQTSTLITREMEVYSIYNHANNITEIKENDAQEDKKITKWKNMGLIPVEKAKNDIK